MNERIQALLTQSGLQPYYDAQQGQIEKFARLIVRECAERLMQDDFGSVKGVMSIAGARLKEHFGVQE